MLLVAGLAAPAGAQDDAARARAAFQRGVAAYSNGRFGEALDAFNEANRIKPNPVVLYNIGQAESELGRFASAVAHFEQYQREAKNIAPERRSEVKKEILRLKSKQARLAVDANVDGARVTLDGVAVGATPLGHAIALDPGPHKLVIGHEGFDDYTSEFTAASSETVRLSAKLAPVSPPRPAVGDSELPKAPVGVGRPGEPVLPAPHEAPAPTPPPRRTARTEPVRPPPPRAPPPTVVERPSQGLSKAWFITGVVVTGGLATATAIVGATALSNSNEYNDPKTSPARRQTLLNSGPGLAHATDGLLIGTIVAAGVTTWLFFKTDWGVTPTPGGVAVAGHF
jgi:hypothetical protein